MKTPKLRKVAKRLLNEIDWDTVVTVLDHENFPKTAVKVQTLIQELSEAVESDR